MGTACSYSNEDCLGPESMRRCNRWLEDTVIGVELNPSPATLDEVTPGQISDGVFVPAIRETTPADAPEARTDTWVADTTVHLTVHWQILHSLDFISGVVDFVNTVKGVRNEIFYYGFGRREGTQKCFEQAVCWEGYNSADAFMYHLRKCASAPIAKIREYRRRTLTPTSSLGLTGLVREQRQKIADAAMAAGEIVCIEAFGPRLEVEQLQSKLESDFDIRSYATDELAQEGALYIPDKYPGPRFFQEDRTVTVLFFWEVIEQDFYTYVPGFRSNFAGHDSVKRFSIANALKSDSASGQIVCFTCYSDQKGFKSHWNEGYKEIVGEAMVSAGKVRQVQLHGPSEQLEGLRSSGLFDAFDDFRCWSSVLGAFYCPSRFDPTARVTGDFHSGGEISHFISGARKSFLIESDGIGPERCIISKDRLRRVAAQAQDYFKDSYTSKTMYDVNEAIIQPACKEAGKPFALIPNDDHDTPAPVGTKFVFVTHAWGENFSTFVDSVTTTVERMEDDEGELELYLWICAFALYQSADSKVISTQLGDDPTAAPFTKALCQAQNYLVVRNTEVDIYTRIWCCWELYCALREGFLTSNTFRIAGPNGFQSSGNAQVDIASAKASDLEDKRKILGHIFTNEGVYQHINLLITIMKQV